MLTRLYPKVSGLSR